MDAKKLGLLACLDKVVVICLDRGVVACLYKNNNKDDFDEDRRQSLDDCFEYFLLAYPL